jgi:hypothetical protein
MAGRGIESDAEKFGFRIYDSPDKRIVTEKSPFLRPSSIRSRVDTTQSSKNKASGVKKLTFRILAPGFSRDTTDFSAGGTMMLTKPLL